MIIRFISKSPGYFNIMEPDGAGSVRLFINKAQQV